MRIEVIARLDPERSSFQRFGFARSILYGERTGHSESVRIGYCKGCFAAVVHGDLVSVTRLFGQSFNDCGFEHILRNIQRYFLRPDAACRIAVRRRVTDSDDDLGHVVAAEAVGRFECRTRRVAPAKDLERAVFDSYVARFVNGCGNCALLVACCGQVAVDRRCSAVGVERVVGIPRNVQGVDSAL